MPKSNTRKRRLIYLDLIRGFLLIFIILNHIPFSPKYTDLFTGNGILISSAAEGFFLLSGLMVSFLYLPKILSQTRSVLSKLWRRSALLYIISVSTTILFTLMALFLSIDPTEGGLYTGNILSLDFIRQTLSLLYTYGWADFLSRYAVFMLLSPVALFLIAYRKTWVLITLSALLWFTAPVVGFEFFSAWQIYFTVGIIIGANLERVLIFFTNKRQWWIPATLFTITGLTFAWSLYVDLLYPHFIIHNINSPLFIYLQETLTLPVDIRASLFNKEFAAPLRVIVSITWFISSLILVRRFEQTIRKYTGDIPVFLGANSLAAYTVHAFIIFFVFTVFVSIHPKTNLILSTLIGLAAVLLTYIITKLYLYMKNKAPAFTRGPEGVRR